MRDSAQLADILAQQISFKHTLQLWQSWSTQARAGEELEARIRACSSSSPSTASATAPDVSSHGPSNDDPNPTPCSPCPEPKLARSCAATDTRIAKKVRASTASPETQKINRLGAK